MKRLIIFKNKKNDECERLVGEIISLLDDSFDCIVADNVVKARSLVKKGADAAICLGGDGTILAIADEAAESDTPILGINLGHLGYMAGLEADELGLLKSLSSGGVKTEKRFMLNACVTKSDGETEEWNALNEILISRGAEPKMLKLRLTCGGTDVAAYHADGLIASTPTGSTAYALSAGGSIIDPTLSLISVCPVCPHTFAGARPLVFSPDSKLRITVSSPYDCDIFLTADGKPSAKVCLSDIIDITGSKRFVRFIKLKDNSFYQTLYKKFKAGV